VNYLDDDDAPKTKLPKGLVLDERPPFVPRMVMTPPLMKVIKNVVFQWKHRDAFQELIKYGIRPLDRLLFHGPPGNGKTLTCYWMAKELGIPMYRVICNQLRGGYLGDTAKAIAAVGDYLNSRTEPAICLFDEVESIFIDRALSSGQCDREISSALTIFLQSLDRWQAPTLIVMATNMYDQLDQALTSRVEMKLEFGGPTVEQCQQLLQYWGELLCKHGADDWGPPLLDRVKVSPPVSFRELQQAIAWSARDWVAAKCS
jgi:ATP-dependent 26S proteasome regulatory subunit